MLHSPSSTFTCFTVILCGAFIIAVTTVDVKDVLGITHVGGKYWITGEPFLQEGANRIEEIGASIIKVWMGDNYNTNNYPWNSAWPENISSLTELGQTEYFMEVFQRPQLKTVVISASGFAKQIGGVYWKDGMDDSEIEAVMSEITEFIVFLRTTFQNKTFVLQHWEGDNAFGEPDNVTLAEEGMVDWLNARQAAINQGKAQTPASNVQVWGAAEFNHVPGFGRQRDHYILDNVIPNTNMDLYSFSDWLSQESIDELYPALDFIGARCPDSEAFGAKNIYIGEFGSKENRLEGGEEEQVQSAGRQIEMFFKWGVHFAIFWEIYDSSPKGEGDYQPGQKAVNDDMKGTWLIRPDNTKPMLYDFVEDILPRDLSVYKNVYEMENQMLNSTADGVKVLRTFDEGSYGNFLSAILVPSAGKSAFFEVYVTETTTYQFKIRIKLMPDAGILKMAINAIGLGQEIDGYAEVIGYQEVTLNETRELKAGYGTFRFKTLDKNVNSSGYNQYIDYFKMTKV